MTTLLIACAIIFILIAGRYFGSPKLACNLLLALAMSVIFGYCVKSIITKVKNTDNTNKEIVSKVIDSSMQSDNCMNILWQDTNAVINSQTGIVGKLNYNLENNFTKNNIVRNIYIPQENYCRLFSIDSS